VIDSCTFNQFNLQLISFESIFKTIEVNFINDLEKYQLLPAKRVTRDIKKLLYHHIFYGTCEYLLNRQSRERVVLLKSIQLDLTGFEVLQHFDRETIQKHVDQVALKVVKLLPINMYGYENIEFRLLKHLYSKGDGNVIELIERIRSFAWTKDFTRSHYTFANVKGFAKRNELTFLSEKYFNQLKTKQLLYI
jgi:hypothetical protein